MKETEFYDRIKDEVAINMPEHTISVTEVVKNNGLKLHGLIAARKESRISPTVYLENFYRKYEEGWTMSELVSEITDIIHNNTGEGIDVGYFNDYDKVKDRIIYKVINYDLNREMLKNVPFFRWNDLAIVFCHICDEHALGYATILIRDEHVRMWGVTREELYERASVNTPGLMKDELNTMDSVLSELSGCFVPENVCDGEMDAVADNMYILSNQKRIFGASTMLYSGYLKSLANRYESGLYILPSSIHEIIILPENAVDDRSYMRNMICEVNETQVSLEERLSDNLYYYDREMDQIRIAV